MRSTEGIQVGMVRILFLATTLLTSQFANAAEQLPFPDLDTEGLHGLSVENARQDGAAGGEGQVPRV